MVNPPAGVATSLPPDASPADLNAVQASWEDSLAALLKRWFTFSAKQTETILDAVEHHVSGGDIVSLLNISVSYTEAAAALEEEMRAIGSTAGQQVVKEAVAQGLSEGDIHAIPLDTLRTAQSAQVYASQMATVLIGSALGETMRVWARGRSARDVRDDVAGHMDSLTQAYPELVIGGALTQAQHDGRWGTLLGGPEAALYADEFLDKNTCKPCREINRKWIGNASDAMPSASYPTAGYIGCLGRWRCRGQVVSVWRGGNNWREWVELPAQRGG